MDVILEQVRSQYKGQRITDKQWYQLISFCRKTQPYLPFKETAFLVLMQKTVDFCIIVPTYSGHEDRFREDLKKFMSQYYPYGYKNSNKSLSDDVYKNLLRLSTPRFQSNYGFPTPYNPIEKICFVKTQRACFKWLTGDRSDDSTQQFIECIKTISNLIRR